MHGQPRRPEKPEDAAAEAAKASKLRDLQAQVLHNHHSRTYTEEAIGLSSKLLEMNPEAYTAWNYRKLALQHNIRELSDQEAIKSAIRDELRLVEVALRGNPKSYGPWYHRKWVLSQKLAPVDFKHELGLVDKLLKADARNFHGWNYRRFVARLKDASEEEELKFTIDMIDRNFSNYSAWHNRSVLLSNLLKKKSKGLESKQSILSEEFERVAHAVFTDPSDQSGWFYHLWLLAQTSSTKNPQLIASWPCNGANLTSSMGKEKDDGNVLSSSISMPSYSLKEGILPIVLYFNEPVKGLNSSNVQVSSDLVLDRDVVWKPLSVTHSGQSNCWVAYLEITKEKCSNSQPYPVAVSIPCSNDIASPSGSHYNFPVQFTFTVGLNNNTDPEEDGDLFHDLVSWDCSVQFHCHENSGCPPFNQLRITSGMVQEDSEWQLERLSIEIDKFREVYDHNSKFVRLTLARLLLAYAAIKSRGSSLIERKAYYEEALRHFDGLIKLDPSHGRYYEDERSLVQMDQVTSDMGTLVKYCSLYVQPNSATSHRQNCLQLRRLSLTRIGFPERLMWVQMLDLSHNKLRSVEGVEALQHLVCMNIANNQIGSFTALEPLKLIVSLRVLDVSFNEIGARSIDTTRYLCSSPFSHKVESCVAIEECRKQEIDLEEHWDAILFFRSVNLAQLDIRGNAVADAENFRTLVTTVSPSLRWLDGERVC